MFKSQHSPYGILQTQSTQGLWQELCKSGYNGKVR
jgi:hypothetical protein